MGCLSFTSHIETCYDSSSNAGVLPVINRSPVTWKHVYNALKEAQKVKKFIFENNETIILFDLQLSIKAIMLKQEPDIQSGFVFCMGESQVVFCVLKLKFIGKLIHGSGLDQSFTCRSTFLKSTNNTLDALIHLGTSDLKQNTNFQYLFCSVL